MNIENLELKELESQELQETNGGIVFWLTIGIAIGIGAWWVNHENNK